MKVRDMFAELTPVGAPSRHRVELAAKAAGVDVTTAYRWLRHGMGRASLAHVLALVDAVDAKRRERAFMLPGHVDRGSVTVAEIRELIHGESNADHD